LNARAVRDAPLLAAGGLAVTVVAIPTWLILAQDLRHDAAEGGDGRGLDAGLPSHATAGGVTTDRTIS
jgi:hypothetical protein